MGARDRARLVCLLRFGACQSLHSCSEVVADGPIQKDLLLAELLLYYFNVKYADGPDCCDLPECKVG